jgi:hypothetical protein
MILRTILLGLICLLLRGQGSDTEARAVLGMEQTGASAADPSQKLFFDFLIDRQMSAKWISVWGEVEVASFPGQISTPVAQLNLAGTIANLQVNRLAESGAFSTGVDVHPFRSWTAGGGTRRLGFVLDAGATGPFPPRSRLSLFTVPAPGSPQYASFLAAFPQAANASYIGFLPPDRSLFYRSWGAGIRITTSYGDRASSTYTFTIGQDEQVSGGALRGAAAKFDVFYPLPVRMRGYNYLYLFGTGEVRLARATNIVPFVLAPAPAGITGSEASVAIATMASDRDIYRIGVGLDAVGIICAIFQGTCN